MQDAGEPQAGAEDTRCLGWRCRGDLEAGGNTNRELYPLEGDLERTLRAESLLFLEVTLPPLIPKAMPGPKFPVVLALGGP